MNSILSNLGPRYSRRNSTTPIILGFLLLIIAIAVLTYFLTRDDDDGKDKKDENTGENVPSIEDPTVTRTLLPDSSNSSESGTTETYEIGGGKTETYKVEYNDGISDIELSKNVKIGITWSNKSGFENVTKLDIEHYVDTVKKNTKSINRYDESGVKISANEDYFKNYAKDLIHEFQGLEPYDKNSTTGKVIVDSSGRKKSNSKAYSFVGEHTIKIIATYTGKDSDKTINLTDGTTTETVKVKTEDLAATLELTAPDVRVFAPIQGSFNLGDAIIENQSYYASSGGLDIHKSIDVNRKFSESFTLIRASTDNSNQFYFKFNETEYLGYDSNKKLSIDAEANKKIITLVSSSLDDTEGVRYFRLSFSNDLYALIDTNGNGTVKTMADIETETVYNTLDWAFSTDDRSTVTEKPIEFVSVSFVGRPKGGTYYIQNVGSEKWAYLAPGNKMIFDKSTRQIDNAYKFEVKHVPGTTDEITLKSISTGKYCDFYTAYSYTPCNMSDGYGGKYKMSQLNTDTYFMSDKSSGAWKKCKPNTNTSDEPVFSCFGETGGVTGSLAQMFKFELV